MEGKVWRWQQEKGSRGGINIFGWGGRRDRGALVLHCEDTARYKPRRELLPGANQCCLHSALGLLDSKVIQALGLCDGGPSHAGYPGSINILKGMSSDHEGCGSWFGSFMSILSSRCVSIMGAVSQAHNAERPFCCFPVFLYPAASQISYCHEYLCFLPLGGHIGLPTDSGSIKKK